MIMPGDRLRMMALLVCGLACVAVAPRVRAQQLGEFTRSAARSAALKGIRETPPLKARLWMADKKDRDVILVGYADDRVACGDANGGPVREVLEKRGIQRAYFELTLDEGALAEAERKRDWVTVYAMLSSTLAGTLTYLDLPDNNAAEPVWRLCDVMLRIAGSAPRIDSGAEARERVNKQYRAARSLYRQLAGATWSPLAELARVREVQCLLWLGEPEQAREALEDIREPMPGENSYGFYWLARAMLAERAGRMDAALDAAVLSLAFENKDIDTFPDALLLSARCYEALEELHRARDVYFETASLFVGTDWEADALRGLRRVLDTGKTATPEEVTVEDAFFGFDEDLEELSRKLVEERREVLKESD